MIDPQGHHRSPAACYDAFMPPGFGSAFTEYASRKLQDHFAQIRRCVSLLSDDQLWFRPNDHSNSVANLLLHLQGNVRQWVLGGVGGDSVERDRQAEFDARGSVSGEALLGPLAQTVNAACSVIGNVTDASILEERTIQGYRVTVLAAIMHVVEHFAFHTGQIVTTTKWLRDVDLSIYDEKGHRRDGRQDAMP
jgi:uncharacterized damage-inducible protein DinB